MLDVTRPGGTVTNCKPLNPDCRQGYAPIVADLLTALVQEGRVDNARDIHALLISQG